MYFIKTQTEKRILACYKVYPKSSCMIVLPKDAHLLIPCSTSLYIVCRPDGSFLTADKKAQAVADLYLSHAISFYFSFPQRNSLVWPFHVTLRTPFSPLMVTPISKLLDIGNITCIIQHLTGHLVRCTMDIFSAFVGDNNAQQYHEILTEITCARHSACLC